ncbi:hypothetical protein AXE80_07455 [Wenyingzhuangia fucanilytica]|uniref:histidine kinase n=1 Tax=Wenyingzhuangia fucanilytica TaxID=1790137 RepID=A0A1B1Y5R2_9FLAO|nr:two-component regulator propeller domain-containing protein [Wenyingzhuangia fucanilytica]ANW96122.1 hypothetical protein AXE80_07455 [Wenyingzhuangia fucanilytica]
MTHKPIYFLFLFLLLNYNYAQEKQVKYSNQRIESFNNKHGFYQNTINTIVSDNNGYLWIATPNGLVKYDGYSFEYFYNNQSDTESLPSNYISNLLTDSQGKLWIGTREGLCVYLTDKEQFMTVNTSVENETFIKEDANNRIWVGDFNKIDVFNAVINDEGKVEKIAEINLEKVLNGATITDIDFLSNSELLVATTQKIFKIDFNDKENYSIGVIELNIKENIGKIKNILKVNNSIWIGTNSGLFHTFYENGQLLTLGTYFAEDLGAFNKKRDIIALYLDKKKNIWIGTKNNGVLKYDSKNRDFTSFKYDSKYKNVITSNRVNCFYEDDFGVMWIGTAQGGLNKFDQNQKDFQNYSHNAYDDKSLSSNLITDITEDNTGRIWLSFFGSTICKTEEKVDLSTGKRISFNRLEKQLGSLKNQWVLCLYQDFKGYWWIGTNKDVYLYDEKNNNLKKVLIERNQGNTTSLIFNRVIKQVNSDQIILGGPQVLRLDNPWESILKGNPIKVEKELFNIGKNNQINDYVKDSYGNHWFASSKGLYRVVDNNNEWSIKNYFTISSSPKELSLSYNYIFNIHIDTHKNVWLGTFGGGLMKVALNKKGQPQNIKSYHREDGLHDEVIYGILEDNQEKLWLSTDMGICVLNLKDESFNFYDVNDGILGNNFRQSAFLKTKNGTMLMGGVDGLTIFNPEQIVKNENEPKILISRLKINNQPIVPGEKVNGNIILKKSISDTEKLIVEHSNRNISLDIIVHHSVTPNKNKIAYKLEGVNKDWIEVEGGKTTATYTNLSPGTYKFLYKGANGDGVWTTTTSDFLIKVLAPWYLRWWSIGFLIIVILAFLYGVFQYFVRLEKLNQKLKFEQLEKERVREMNQAKLRFFTNISHDFKTPLSLIIGPLEKIADQYQSTENKKYFGIIQNNILRLQRLIDQLIAYRKAETGHLELNYSKVSLGDLLYPLMDAFDEYAQQSLFNFYYKIDQPNKILALDIDKTERVLLNLFSNAVKYSNLDKEISIDARIEEENNEELLVVKVINSGTGIPPEKIDRIFDRFYRGVDDKNDWSGTGIGLALCKSLIELMNGSISVISNNQDKTVFRISLPIVDNGEYVHEEELDKYKKIVTDWLPSELETIQDDFVDTSRPSILIVDDEQDVRTFLYEAFKNDYNVILAIDGEDAIKKVNEAPPQLIISDVMMPKLDGYELCEKIKSNSELCHIPIILLTAIGDNFKKLEGLESGADDYIVKPFSIKYLEVRVKKLIENKQRVFEYFSRNSFLPKDSLISSSKDKQFLESINVSIEKNMSNSGFGVEELATDIGMSTSHFYRKLKELTGQAPNAYLRNFRLQKAAELLTINKNLTAADVMFEIGIESKSYYSSAFKKIHGVSPSEFVKKND